VLIRSQSANQVTTATCSNTIEVTSSERDTFPGPEITEAEVTVIASEALVDHGYSVPPQEVLKYKLTEAEKKREELQKKLRNANVREKRAKTKSKTIMDELKTAHLLHDELQAQLDKYQDFPLHLFSKPVSGYTEEQKEFALTLHLYSSKAYDYLRDTVRLQLPHPRTLRRWLESVDSKPGINASVLNMLCDKKAENPDVYTRFSFQLDAMAIRKHVSWDPHTRTMSGFVDLGNGVEEGNEEAKEVLVFMLVSLNGRFKTPVAYFLTRTLSAVVQKELVLHVLDELHNRGFEVVSLTMDGHATNVSMCRSLGCSFSLPDNFRSWFLLPGSEKKIFVLYDACHMLKLVRNMLEAYGTVWSAKGPISWKFITDLHRIQQTVGLRAANRLSQRHVGFKQQIMKVSLAAQTLSSSVASTMQLLMDLGFPEFREAAGMIEFLQIIDRLFDSLNSCSPKARGFKAPIRQTNAQSIREFLLTTRQYLIGLHLEDGTPLFTSKRCTCIIGFIADIDAAIAMMEYLLSYQDYILMYKFSQDHLELFFNAVRRSGGWNNNPTANQFKYAFRRLIVRSGVQAGKTGNVVAVDEISADVAADPNIWSQSSGATSILHDHSDYTLPAVFVDNAFHHCSALLDAMLQNTLVYIAGWVVRKMFEHLRCETCRLSLISTEMPTEYYESYHLLTLKDNGGLVVPSHAVVKIVTVADKVVREQQAQLAMRKITSVPVVSRVLAEIGNFDILQLGSHIDDTSDGIDNHHFSLIRTLVDKFVTLRLHHLAKLHTLDLQRQNIRQKLTKTILFKGH
jgi:hypothetical protein